MDVPYVKLTCCRYIKAYLATLYFLNFQWWTRWWHGITYQLGLCTLPTPPPLSATLAPSSGAKGLSIKDGKEEPTLSTRLYWGHSWKPSSSSRELTWIREIAIFLHMNRVRAVVWPGKNHKYFKKRKLNNEFQSFFLFNILLPEIHSDIKMLYNFVNSNMYKMFGQKNIYIF